MNKLTMTVVSSFLDLDDIANPLTTIISLPNPFYPPALFKRVGAKLINLDNITSKDLEKLKKVFCDTPLSSRYPILLEKVLNSLDIHNYSTIEDMLLVRGNYYNQYLAPFTYRVLSISELDIHIMGDEEYSYDYITNRLSFLNRVELYNYYPDKEEILTAPIQLIDKIEDCADINSRYTYYCSYVLYLAIKLIQSRIGVEPINKYRKAGLYTYTPFASLVKPQTIITSSLPLSDRINNIHLKYNSYRISKYHESLLRNRN